MQKLKSSLKNIIFLFAKILPIKRNQLLFLDYYGAKYGDSPRFLSEYITMLHPDWKIVWAFNNPEDFSICGVQKVRYMSIKFFYILTTSKVLVTNYRMPEFFKKRKGQYYLQSWHSSLRLKKIEQDALENLPSHYVKMAQLDSKNIDLILSGCKFSSNTFRNSLWYKGEVLESGTPRIDKLMRITQEEITKLKDKFHINENEKVILYCPTFRKLEEDKKFYLNVPKFYTILKDFFLSVNWKLLVRYHPHEMHSFSIWKDEEGISNVTDYCDVQDLLAVSDILITDYSGVMFDYTYTFKPCFLYVPDIEEYTKKERRLYFDIRELPFPISHDLVELIDDIKSFNEDSYKKNVEDFLKSIGTFEKGEACKRICERIEEWIK